MGLRLGMCCRSGGRVPISGAGRLAVDGRAVDGVGLDGLALGGLSRQGRGNEKKAKADRMGVAHRWLVVCGPVLRTCAPMIGPARAEKPDTGPENEDLSARSGGCVRSVARGAPTLTPRPSIPPQHRTGGSPPARKRGPDRTDFTKQCGGRRTPRQPYVALDWPPRRGPPDCLQGTVLPRSCGR